MNCNSALEFIDELNNYLKLNVGIGQYYGTLGHVIGGILSHQVLHDDPYCHALNKDGSYKECTLNAEDKSSIVDVYNNLKQIRKLGIDNKFCDKLEELKNYIKSKEPITRSYEY